MHLKYDKTDYQKTLRRLCPRCSESSPMSDDEPFWPLSFICPFCNESTFIDDSMAVLAPELDMANENYPIGAFEKIYSVEQGHFWFESRNSMIAYFLNRYFPNPTSFLEVGCGTGFALKRVCEEFPNCRTAGTDIHTSGLKLARHRMKGRAEIFQSDGLALPFEKTFDVIGAFDVIEHIEHDEAMLASFRRALVAGGGLLLNVPQHMALWSGTDRQAGHQRRYARGELEKKLVNSGYKILDSTSYVFVLLPIMFISRLLRRDRGNLPHHHELDAELLVSAPVNAILRTLLSVEVAFMKLGIRYPVGGSRFVVARKDGP